MSWQENVRSLIRAQVKDYTQAAVLWSNVVAEAQAVVNGQIDELLELDVTIDDLCAKLDALRIACRTFADAHSRGVTKGNVLSDPICAPEDLARFVEAIEASVR